jgi:AraC family transcriptional regulator of adaptative response / DNA-3-methyladenine glycosylase II
MPLDLPTEALQRARLSRDPRFDGKFVVAVLSTRIYCRVTCPISPAHAVRFYATPAEAEAAGFRPCLRCRPETAPGSPAWCGTTATVRRALRLIDEGALDRGSVQTLAARLGIGPRHLHRLLINQVGTSPVAIAQTRRLHFAKTLLSDTTMPITDLALASGYRSVRRFNAAFKETYKRAPRDIRRHPLDTGTDITLRLAYRPPLDFPASLAFLAEGAIPGVEQITNGTYIRALRGKSGPFVIRVSSCPGLHELRLQVHGAAPADLFDLATTTRRVFDLNADPEQIHSAFDTNPVIGPLVRARPGLRIIGTWSPFEAAIRAILGNFAGGPSFRATAARLLHCCFQPAPLPETDLTHLFPSPAELARADLTHSGFPTDQQATLQHLAAFFASEPAGALLTLEEIIDHFARLPGLDQSRAHYVALRGLGEPDAYPAHDRGYPNGNDGWRPWRGYAAFHLWHASLVGG